MFALKISEDTIDKFADFVNAAPQSSSFIVSGPSDIGKKYIIEEFLKKRLSTNNLIHHNLLWLDAEQSGISADRIREIYDFIYKTSYDNKTKFVVINAVDKLNVFAYNSLLKVLEEPTRGTQFILISSHYKLLPATIKSRCITVKFSPASEDDSYKVVRSKNPDWGEEDLKKYCYLANNAPFRVLKFIEEEYLTFYEEFVDMLFNFFLDPQESLKLFDKILQDVDQKLICYAFNHIITKTILYIFEGNDNFQIKKEEELIKQILYFHPSMAELLLLEEYIKHLTLSLDKSKLSKQNIFLLITYKLMYK